LRKEDVRKEKINNTVEHNKMFSFYTLKMLCESLILFLSILDLYNNKAESSFSLGEKIIHISLKTGFERSYNGKEEDACFLMKILSHDKKMTN
jgi:hypothetical protein